MPDPAPPKVATTRQTGSRAGRRPALPQVDMDANELLKVRKEKQAES